jgi:hypothetical protein
MTLPGNKLPFEYSIRKSKRAKRMTLSIYPDGGVVVTVPLSGKDSAAHEFVRAHTQWIQGTRNYYTQFTDVSLAGLTRRDYLRSREQARSCITSRLEYFAAMYGLAYNRVSIRDQKTCWGSCTAKRNLNFNYKLLYLPQKLRDYIIVHELCHLAELNHSERFWELVARAVPEYQKYRLALRKIL